MLANRPAQPKSTGGELVTRAGLDVLVWPAFEALGVDVVVTTQAGGVSSGPYASLNLGLHVGDDPQNVSENRRRAAACVGAGVDDLVFARQVHGAEVAVVTGADRGRGARTAEDALDGIDALVCTEAGPVLAVLVADCVPIVLFDPDAGVLATVHAGWRGTVARIVDSTIGEMVRAGAVPERLVAGVGPAVSATSYEVGPEVASAARAAMGPLADRVLTATPSGTADHWRLDLPNANRLQLEGAGVRAESVHVADRSTGDGIFFSDRAQRPCGRFALLARRAR